MAKRNHTFISYKREEQDKARSVYESLESNNVDVWWDEDLQGGQKWEEEIDVALGTADAVVVLWSSLAKESEWVRSEAAIAKHNSTLVNVLMEPCEIPPPFRLVQFEDLSSWKGDSSDDAILQLVAAIRSKRQLIAKTRSKAILYRNIAVATLAGIAVCLALILANWANADLIVDGTVVDNESTPVHGAVVAIPEIGSSITDRKGRFQLGVPTTRRMKDYSIEISRVGFLPHNDLIDDSRTKGIKIQLESLSSNELVAVASKVAVGHYFGTPQVDLRVEFMNPTDKMIRFELRALRLTGEGQDPIDLPLFQQYFEPGTPRANAVPLVLLHSDDPKYNPTFIFSLLDQETVLLGMEVQRVLASTQFAQFGPRLGTPLLPKQLSDRLTSHAERRWKWEPIEYTLDFRFDIGADQYSVVRRFVLTDDQISSMKKIASYYECGFGCVYGMHEFTVEDGKPFVQIDTQIE